MCERTRDSRKIIHGIQHQWWQRASYIRIHESLISQLTISAFKNVRTRSDAFNAFKESETVAQIHIRIF